MPRSRPRLRLLPALALAPALLCAPLLCGCEAVGGALANLERTGSRTVHAEYQGLSGKSFAVLVSADRAIQSEHPGLVEYLSVQVTQRLSNPANVPPAGGFVASDQVLAFQGRNPDWAARPIEQLAKDLGGVQRVIIIEVLEFRLHEPGNRYEWAGAAGASLSIYEADSTFPEEVAFQRTVNVTFPDARGFGPDNIERRLVSSVLASRVVDRASWPMYKHEEPNEIPY